MSVPTKELKFIHITKTAGSSIETVGLEKNKRWGINHKEYGFWHEIFPNKSKSLKEKYDWFMVVRNPYKRILSEYHFLAGIFNYNHTCEDFNNFVRKWATNASHDIESHHMYGRRGGDHFTEQYKYLDPNINIHVLKFENIEEEFNNLMNLYNYNIVLNKRVQVSKQIFTLKDFSDKTIKLIQTIYKKDFEIFDYPLDIDIYMNEIQNKSLKDNNELKFIHITKTGGTYIEEIGFDNNIRWGKYHTEYGYPHSIFSKKGENFKNKYKWFMVVRDPYTRIIAEYYHLCNVIPEIVNYSVKQINKFLVKWILAASNGEKEKASIGRCHFIEQYKYLDPKIDIHILKYENIKEDFNNLMIQYNYDFKLENIDNTSENKFRIDDLTNETIDTINNIYKKDFELFGYTKKVIIKQDIIESTNTESTNTESENTESAFIKTTSKKKLKYIPITRIANKFIKNLSNTLGLKWGESHNEYGNQFETFLNKDKELKEKYDWFMIVRDPYTRILSEYEFILNAIYINKKHSKDEFNTIIRKWIENVKFGKENHPNFGKKGGDHFTEQYKYYDKNNKPHIIKYENLENEIKALLKEYDYNCNNIKFNKEMKFTFSISDISNENIKLINNVYKKDFQLFNYDMIITENKAQKELKFIHITRNGGTSIEHVGLEKNIFWGRYDRFYGTFDESFTLKSESLKQNYIWFTIVRNPYTKIISEYNYLKVILRIRDSDNINTFNSYIEKWLVTINKSDKVLGWHLVPQHTYIDNKYDITILKYENLTNEFNTLMDNYKYDIKLNRHVNISNKKFSVNDISSKNIELIKLIYKKDFEQFNYPVDYSN